MFKHKHCQYYEQCPCRNEKSPTCTKTYGMGGNTHGNYCGKFIEFDNQGKVATEALI